jgi:nicotinamidase-related amidase/transcriptional regulator with XRE-family HTH domain
LAGQVRVSRKTLERWERDEREPGASALRALAESLDVTSEYLLGRIGEPSFAKLLDLKPFLEVVPTEEPGGSPREGGFLPDPGPENGKAREDGAAPAEGESPGRREGTAAPAKGEGRNSGMKPAFLIVDMQRRFFERRGEAARRLMESASGVIEEVAGLFREKGLPLVWIRHEVPGEGLVPGAPDFELLETLHPRPEDLRIVKRHGSAFRLTSLEEDLRSRGVDALVIAGFAAEYCVLSTSRCAEDLGLRPMLLREGLATAYPERLPFVEAVNPVIALKALRVWMELL